MTYVGALSVLNLGINTTLVKYVGELLPQGRLYDVECYFGTSITLFLMGGLSVAAAACLGAPWIVRHFLHAPRDIQSSVDVSLWIASGAFLMRFLGQALSAIPLGAQRFDLANSINVSVELLRTLGSVAILHYSGFLLQGVMAVTLFSDAVSCGIYYLLARSLLPGVSLRPRWSRPHFRALLRFSKFVLVGNLSTRMVNSADNFLIGYFLPVSSIAFYGVPYAIGQRLWTLIGNVASAVFPAASAFSGSGSAERLRTLYVRGSKASAVVVCFPAMAICILARPFLNHWMSPDFAQHSTIVLRLLSLAFLVNCLGHVPFLILQATHFPEIAARFASLYAVINLALFGALIPIFGIVGAAAGFLIAQLIVVPWMIHHTNRLLHIPLWLFLSRSYWPIAPASVPGLMVCSILLPWIDSLFRTCVVAGIGLALYAVLVWVIALDNEERAACLGFLETIIPGHTSTRDWATKLRGMTTNRWK
jgi:O-antigen/teichoic acid export membrane protein